ncbi:MAG: glycosyl hydrolase [Burkholderiaceae bacterium]|nr:glycosyl hydrolase [Burkholderiaceae bacterium]
MKLAGLSAALLATTAATTAAMAAPPALMPYKDVSLAVDAANPRIATAVAGGAPQLLPQPGGLPGRADALIWSFATGECGAERWGPFDTAEFARLNVAAFAAAGAGYIVATGGEAGIFTCASDAAMAAFVARYDSPQLRGFDFDIEGAQTPAQMLSLMQRIAAMQPLRPGLRWSVTLATHAADDGSRQGLNRTGEQVLAAARQAGVLERLVVNLMVMNYGPAARRHCVRRAPQPAEGPRCDMGASALQAARNLSAVHGIPLSRIAVTPMLGRNDVADNRFDLADARRLAEDARSAGLEAVHFWSLDRDRPCDGPGAAAGQLSPTCHGLPGLAPLDFTTTLRSALPAPR